LQSLPGTPGGGKGKGGGNSPKKAFTPKAGGGGGFGKSPKGKQGDYVGGGSPGKQQTPKSEKFNKQSPQQQKPQGISAKLSQKSPKQEQNGNSKPVLKQLDAKSKAIAKQGNQTNAGGEKPNRSMKKRNKKASNRNQMQRFNKVLKSHVNLTCIKYLEDWVGPVYYICQIFPLCSFRKLWIK